MDARTDTGLAFDSGGGCGSGYIAFRYVTTGGAVHDVCVVLTDGVRQDFLSSSGCRPASVTASGVFGPGSRIVIDAYADPFSSIGNHTFGVTVESASTGDPDLCGPINGTCRLFSLMCVFDVTRAGGRGEIVEANLATNCTLTDGMTSGTTGRAIVQLTNLTIRAPLVRGTDLGAMASDAGTTVCP